MTAEESSKDESHESSLHDESENYRMWAAISFAIMLLVIGIPLWWKTTEVHRASLPYDDIDRLNSSSYEITLTIFVCVKSMPPRQFIDTLESFLGSFDYFKLHFRELKIPGELLFSKGTSELKIKETASDIFIVEVPDLEENTLFLSKDRVIYISKDTSSQDIARVINEIVLCERKIKAKITSIVTPQLLNEEDQLNSLRASLAYDVIVTVINSDPERVKVAWDIATSLKRYFQPFLNQISPLSHHFLKSQWLYMMDLSVTPRRDSSGWNLMDEDHLPHIITPLENKLGSGISKNPCVHLILYITSCKLRPMAFVSHFDTKVEAMISPQWGGIQILNPSTDDCTNRTEITPNAQHVLGIFVAQFHSLLGVREKHNFANIRYNTKSALLSKWELDGLYRIRTIEHLTSASLTLQSLSKLLGEISNIVINKDVARFITEAISRVNLAKDALKKGQAEKALSLSREAFQAAESAFSDPSLLALLYFPDDQKYAVYIPLFLPIMIPVLMSLKKIQMWIMYGTYPKHVKVD